MDVVMARMEGYELEHTGAFSSTARGRQMGLRVVLATLRQAMFL